VGSVSVSDTVGFGIAFNPKMVTPPENVRSAIEALFDEIEQREVDTLLVGGVAILAYVAGRNTQDIDLIVRPEDLGRVSWEVASRDADFARASYRGVQVDLLLTSNPLFAYVAERCRTTQKFGVREVAWVTVEGLLLLKLYALPSLYRQTNLARAALYEGDIRMLRQGAEIDEKNLFACLERHLPKADITELRRIWDETKPRARFVDE
jgi:hypothetical protein